MTRDQKLVRILKSSTREKVLGAIRAKLRRFEADKLWLATNPQHFTIIKAVETLEGLRLWGLAQAAVRRAKR